VLTYSVLLDAMDACWRATLEGTLDFERVFDRGTLASLGAEPLLAERALEMLESGQADIACYAGDVPYIVIVVDDVVLRCLPGGEGAPHAVIETDDSLVDSST